MINFATPYQPEEVGYDKSRLDVLNHHFQTMIEKKELWSASYCLAREGKVFANTSMGKFSFREEDTRALQPDSIHKIASVTKLFCAVAIFQLVENGKLRLTQKVGEFLEEFDTPPFNDITIAHLLSHTSGLQADPGCYENKYFTAPWEYIKVFQGENWIANALRSGMRKKPGEEWAYCSFGFVILGEIISRISGVFAEDYIEENIIKSCEMTQTGFKWTKDTIKKLTITNEHTEQQVNSIEQGENDRGFWAKIPDTGGGLHSTAQDLCNFGSMLLHGGVFNGKRVLGRKAVEKMVTLYTTDNIKDYCWNSGGVTRRYALGPDLRCDEAALYSKGTYFHEGAGGCCLMIDPIEKLVAAWFVPFTDNWYVHGLYNASAIMWSGLL